MFVFFKQKTAYEMRISDWSSDVCSSDLLEARKLAAFAGLGALRDLDLYLVAGAEIFGGDAKAAAGDLLDIAVGIVAVRIGAIARTGFATLARHRLEIGRAHV